MFSEWARKDCFPQLDTFCRLPSLTKECQAQTKFGWIFCVAMHFILSSLILHIFKYESRLDVLLAYNLAEFIKQAKIVTL